MPTNSALGPFLPTQNPLGMFVHVSAPPDCATSPPTRGPAVGDDGALTVSLAQTGFCPTTLTISARTRHSSAVVFPIGSYRVTVDFPAQTLVDPQAPQPISWLGSRASGTLHVGTSFTETDTSALATAGTSDTFAVLLSNSAAGPGAGRLVSTRTANPSVRRLTGVGYYACGTIGTAATLTYGKRGA